jgi:ribosomal protein S18 acetylase RimI-like enzyme
LARAHIALDQVQGLLDSGDEDRVLLVTASSIDDVGLPLAAAVAIHSAVDQAAPHHIDTATVVCAGGLAGDWQGGIEPVASALAEKLDQTLCDRGVNYVQWATDDVSVPENQPLSRWCGALGFEPLSTLEYLSGSLTLEDVRPNPIGDELLVCEPLAWDDSAELEEFASLADQTYRETLDCPRLSEYRTAIQTLRSYQSTVAFEPKWWFRVLEEPTRRTIGCLILARHRSRDPRETRGLGEDVAEIVYMGLVPQARRQGLGSELLRCAMQIARRGDCSRIILAVDRRNYPAKSIYHRAGLDHLFSETVWFKRIHGETQVDRIAGQRSA